MKFVKFILIAICVIAVLPVSLVGCISWLAKQPVVKSDYYNDVVTDKPLEQKYTAMGSNDVSFVEYNAKDNKIGRYRIWYPTAIENSAEKYPLVIMANGTGIPSTKYEAIFEHLASWGFIVIGNEDKDSWNGFSSRESLEFMLNMNEDNKSFFFKKIDLENIGIAGHSQGGVGAINAVTSQDNGLYYKAIYTASTTHLELAKALKWEYDVSKIQIPYFMVAGTLQVDAGDGIEGSSNVGIAPLFSLQENYVAISEQVEKIMARRVNTDHGDMLPYADGYMTAWFMYQLKGDSDAAKVFVGDDAEILSNANWQDVQKNR